MRIIEQSVTLDTITPDAEKLVERAARCCYKSESRIQEGSAEKLIRNCIKRGHESILEHASATFKIVTDRGMLAELTRHRLASFSVESSRYCNYKDGISVIKPQFAELYHDKPVWESELLWETACQHAEESYAEMIKHGCRPEIARSVLPQSLAVTMFMSANLREWRTVLKLRTAKAAHPQMRDLAGKMLVILHKEIPVVFEDLLCNLSTGEKGDGNG